MVRELGLLAESQARFGVGFITWSLERQPFLLDLALEFKPVEVMLSFGDPTPFLERSKRSGAAVLCQVQTLALAKEALAAGADILVAQGTEAGGHGASRGLISLLPEIRDAVGADVPVVAAGGLADARGLAAALLLGASGVLMGTRFYATREAAGADAAKERIRTATGDHTARSIVFDIAKRHVWPDPLFTSRCLRNPYFERWAGREVDLVRHLETESARYAQARSEGDFDIAAVTAGESVGLIHEIPSVHDLIPDMVRGAAALLKAGPAQMERPNPSGKR
jgi:nitronate monooxygenase